MDKSIWDLNHPSTFWQITEQIDPVIWQEAIINSIRVCKIPIEGGNISALLQYTLGEGRFGETHWDLTSINKVYWTLKPFVPNEVIRSIRSIINRTKKKVNNHHWPIDHRYVNFLWETIRQLFVLTGRSSFTIKAFWPENKAIALVLTHDVESREGQSFIPRLADLEEKYGMRSSFNIVGEQMPRDPVMLNEMAARGFEIGIHGWQHNSTPFSSREAFLRDAQLINQKLDQFNLVGHRSPLNLRQPEWMQALNISYDLSFFDTDPFEPIPGGTMSIWPFNLGHFIELPATLLQDNTLINLLGEKTPHIWFKKIGYLRKHYGMALLNSHPEYLIKDSVWSVYEQLLSGLKESDDFWNGLPREAASWWRNRTNNVQAESSQPQIPLLEVAQEDGQIVFRRSGITG